MPKDSRDDGILQHYESDRGKIRGLIIDDYSLNYAHWNAESSLAQWLYNQKIPALGGIDTRSLTQKIREEGVMPAKICVNDDDVPWQDPNIQNLVKEVSITEPKLYGKGDKRIALIDCGCKNSIIKHLVDRGLQVLRLPWNFPVSEEEVDGVVISSGPGDPKSVPETVREVQRLLETGMPTFGICLGHQIMALAVEAQTYKLKYGHRGQNQPVACTDNQKAFITSQNHGYAVDADSLPGDWQNWFNNLNDQTSEGLMHRSGRFFSTQFHPEASPGPTDTSFLFDRFLEVLK